MPDEPLKVYRLERGPLDGDLVRVPRWMDRVTIPCSVVARVLEVDEGSFAEAVGEPSHIYLLKAGVFRYIGTGRPLPDFFAVAG